MTHPVLTFIEHVWNQGRTDLIEQYVADSYCVDDLPFGPSRVRENVEHYRYAFPDLRLDILQFDESASHCATLVKITGTHQHTWKGIEPRGQSVNFLEAGFWQVANDLIVSGTFVVDTQALRRQLMGEDP